jgi:hypothetical protein
MARPTLRQIRTAARAALDAANLYGLAADDALAHPGDLAALRNAREVRATAVDALADAHYLADADGAEDDRSLAGALANLRNAAEVLGACDAALSLGSAAPMAVAS